MRVGIAPSPGCFGSGVTALLDVFASAEGLRSQLDPAIDPISVTVIGAGDSVRTGGRVTLSLDPRGGDPPAPPGPRVLPVPGPRAPPPPPPPARPPPAPVR